MIYVSFDIRSLQYAKFCYYNRTVTKRISGGGEGGGGGGEGVANHTKGYHTKSFSVLNNSVMETVFRNVSVTTQSRPRRTLTTF